MKKARLNANKIYTEFIRALQDRYHNGDTLLDILEIYDSNWKMKIIDKIEKILVAEDDF